MDYFAFIADFPASWGFACFDDLAAYIFVGISIWVDTPELAWTGLAVFAVFLAIYFIVDYFRKKAA